jgi:hypothetical protein
MNKVSEGNIISIPIDDGRYAVGVLARVETARPRKPYGIFVYFFGPFNDPDRAVVKPIYLNPKHYVIRLNTSALDIYSGVWKWLGVIDQWDRNEWPFPDFCQHTKGERTFYRIRYDENDLATQIFRVRMLDGGGLDDNIIYGTGAAQQKISTTMEKLESLDF